ncbi:MAG: bifunctional phosphoribosylaminoimidazolecarboxamide formyltransferase/IMP cyclohydrolase [Phycisphaerae bacterium]|nr:bifunctional phosphoribosylaminoimidazolecarboxamide formyltransferase/IMP cyclohydrolase [Phycisphaerae bacterium]
MPDLVKVTRALISVSDKRGVEALAKGLASHGVEIVSTGGTAALLAGAGVPVTPIDRLTGFPEMMDGRVKTLHPKVHGGLLAIRDHPEHAAAMRAHGIGPIDLLCVNLYPFEQTIAREGVTRDEAIEQIDIGGPAMVRSGSKNHAYVAVLTDPGQYGSVLAEMEVTAGCTSLALRRELAGAAFARTAAYDTAIAAYLNGAGARTAASGGPGSDAGDADARFPAELRPVLRRLATLRYGENPHQPAAVYADPAAAGPSVIGTRQLHGKELSYNNLNDAAAALDLAIALHAQAGGSVAACVIKHANPCGAAVAPDALSAADRAIAGDPLAAFGGIMALSGVIDAPAARRLCEKDVFLEVLIAPDYSPDALDALRARWQNLRILAVGPLTRRPGDDGLSLKFIPGGALAQAPDTLPPDPAAWAHRAGPAPDAESLRAAATIEVIVRAMTSNAVAIGGRDGNAVRLLGGGLGQVDRVTACRIAVEKAGASARGAIAVSDAFFPFPDGPTILAAAGVRMIVHPGGSKRDQETFDLCAARGITCMTTGVRRFRH